MHCLDVDLGILMKMEFFFIDRDPAYFGRIMESLRSGQSTDFVGLSPDEAEKFRAEVNYYHLPAQQVPIRWDVNRCSEALAISEEGTTITHVNFFDDPHLVGVLATTPNRLNFKIRIRNSFGSFAFGHAKGATFNVDRVVGRGWFLRNDGCVCHDGHWQPFCPKLKDQDVVTVYMNTSTSAISFEVNGIHHGVAYTDVNKGNSCILPCVVFGRADPGASISLLD